MTGLLVGALIATVALCGLLGGATVWLAKRALARTDELGDARVNTERSLGESAVLRLALVDAGKATAELEDRVLREIAARKTVEAQRDAALTNLAENGDPDGVADAINNDLARLRALAEEDLPFVPDSARSDRGGGPEAVHGEIVTGDPGSGS